MTKTSVKVMAIVGFKNSGKTTLTTRLISYFTCRGYKVGTVKHGHHKAEIDKPGSDSYRHAEAGSAKTALVTTDLIAIMSHIKNGGAKIELTDILADFTDCDLVLLEGFKSSPYPKLALTGDYGRKGSINETANSQPDMHPKTDQLNPPLLGQENVIAAVTDNRRKLTTQLPVLAIDDIAGIANFIISYLKLTKSKS